MNNYSRTDVENEFNNNDLINISIIKIYNILGDNFELNENENENENEIDTNHNNQIKNNKILNFKFLNKLELKNSEKTKYINDKIELLKKNNFIETEDIKISGKGRFIKINIKTIDDYEKEKKLLLEEFTNKIKLIDEKIKCLCKNK
jgi:hypothetical protein